jgi:hypothetical protein
MRRPKGCRQSSYSPPAASGPAARGILARRRHLAPADLSATIALPRAIASPGPIKRQPTPSRRRALELLAASPRRLQLANGFSIDLLVDLVRGGLASVSPQRMASGGKQIEIARCGSPTRGGGSLDETTAPMSTEA